MKKFLVSILTILSAITMQAQKVYPYQNPQLSPEERAKDLISRLTLEEKARLMLDVSKPIDRLGIPAFQWWNEALHGIGRNGYTTVFPITMGMAASWDDELVNKCFDAASDEARIKNQEAKATGNIMRYQGLSFWTPNINIFRDPRWGRGQETYGEDPYLTSRMGLAVVNGLQGPKDSKYMKLLACAKHYAVHSGPEWNRHSFNIESLPERDLWETYLPAFKVLVQEGNVAEVMCAYQSIDGQPCCAQTRYLQQILRDEWGFKGIVVSDCGAIRDIYQEKAHHYVKTPEEAAEKAVSAGTDVNCGSVYSKIPDAVKKGVMKESDLDASLIRLLVGRFKLGDLDPDNLVSWTKIPASRLCSKEHSDLAYKIAQESMVLLENKGILPLKKDLKVALLGPNANDSVMQWGNYSGYPQRTVTILQGLKAKGIDVKYIEGAGHVNNSINVSHFSELTTADGKLGVKATYWNNLQMTGTPVTEQTYTSPISLNNGGNTVFAPGVNLDNFSGRYETIFRPQNSGTIELETEADDGLRLIINGDTLENRYRGGHGIQKRHRTLKVEAGKEYRIQIDYMQQTEMALFKFDIFNKQEKSQQDILSQIGDADVVVFAGGISPRLEGEEMKVDAYGFKGGDRTDIQLPECQRQLIKAIHDSGKKVVYINCSGSAIALEPEQKNCDAILQAWYPGERGGDAVADILFGDYNPSGKLPITIYRSVDDLPDFLDYTMTGTSADGKSKGRTYRYFNGNPLWSFGYGMSYTDFFISNIKLDGAAYKSVTLPQPVTGAEKGKKNKKTEQKVQVKKSFSGTIKVTIENSGKYDGTEVVQLYVKRHDDVDGPAKTLKAFQRVFLKAGEEKTISLPLTDSTFECWDAASNTMRVIPGQYDVFVGTSSDAKDLQKMTINMK